MESKWHNSFHILDIQWMSVWLRFAFEFFFFFCAKALAIPIAISWNPVKGFIGLKKTTTHIYTQVKISPPKVSFLLLPSWHFHWFWKLTWKHHDNSNFNYAFFVHNQGKEIQKITDSASQKLSNNLYFSILCWNDFRNNQTF